MKKIYQVFTSEYVLVGLTLIAALTLSLLPMFRKLLDAPTGRGFYPVHNSLSDYPFYTAIIVQGIDGQTTVWGRFTAELQERGVVIHYLYLIIGWTGRLFGVGDAHIMYHGARIFFGGAWIMTIYFFVSAFTKNKVARIAGFLLAIFSAGWPVASDYNGKRVIWWTMNWWSELDPVQRAAFIPHYLAGHILMAGAFFSVIQIRSRMTLKRITLLSLTLALSAFIHPPSYIIVAMTSPLWLIMHSKWQTLFKGILAPVFLGGVPLLIIKNEFTVFPWVMSQSFEGLSFYLPISEFIMALGPIFPMGLVGFFLKRKEEKARLLMLWVTVSLVMLQLIRYFPFSQISLIRAIAIANTRFLQVAVWVPLSILSGYFLSWLHSSFPKRVFAVTTVIITIVTLAGFPQSIRFQREKIYGSPYVTWPTPGYQEAIASLRDLVKEDETIWSLPLAGEIIPGFINRTVYTGNENYYTKDLKRKTDTAWGLYHGNLDNCIIYREMKESRVKAVFYSFDEQKAAGDQTGEGKRLREIPFLMPWKGFGDTAIFLFVDARPEECK